MTLAGLPDEVAAVGDDTGGDGRTVVAAPADKHHADLRDLAVNLEVVKGLLGRDGEGAIVVLGDFASVVNVLGANLRVGVLHIRRVDLENGSGGLGNTVGGASITVHGAQISFSVGSHDEEVECRKLVSFYGFAGG